MNCFPFDGAVWVVGVAGDDDDVVVAGNLYVVMVIGAQPVDELFSDGLQCLGLRGLRF